MERSMSLDLNQSIWEDDSEETISQECIHRGTYNSQEMSVESHCEDHNLPTKDKQLLIDLNQIYNDEMETTPSENFCPANRIDQEMGDLPTTVGCSEELIMNQESNTGHDESSMFFGEVSDLETKITAVSLGSKVCVVDNNEGYGDSGPTTHTVSNDRKGKSPIVCVPPNSLHHESSPKIIIDLSSHAPSSSKCELAALSGVTQASETEEQDSHSPVQVAKLNPSLPCTKRFSVKQRRSPRNVSNSGRALGPTVPGRRAIRPWRPKPNLVPSDYRYVQPFPLHLYPIAAKPVKDVDCLRYLNRQGGEETQRVEVPLIPRTVIPDVSGRRGGFRWIEPKPAQDVKPEGQTHVGLGHIPILLRTKAEAVNYITRSRKGKGKANIVVRPKLKVNGKK